jgi:predicted component of type VI protein secretion system
VNFPLIVQPEGGQPRVFAARFTIGRHGDLPLADQSASPLHALCIPFDGTWWVQDLGTAGGTWIDTGQGLIRIRALYELGRGDKLRVGHTTLIVVPA